MIRRSSQIALELLASSWSRLGKEATEVVNHHTTAMDTIKRSLTTISNSTKSSFVTPKPLTPPALRYRSRQGSRHQPGNHTAIRPQANSSSSSSNGNYRPQSNAPQFQTQTARYLTGGQSSMVSAALPAIQDPPVSGYVYDAQDLSGAVTSLSSLGKSEEVEGTIQKILFRSHDTGYTVMKMHAALEEQQQQGTAAASKKSKKREILTIVGNLPHVIVGQSVRLTGTWTEHKTYGRQFRADDVEELRPSTEADLQAYLAGGTIPGVGPVTAALLTNAFKADLEAVLDSKDAVQELVSQCSGIGQRTAERIKAGWDAGQGARHGVRFLKEAGLPSLLAQRVAIAYGSSTKELVERDPYAALSSFKIPLVKIDQVAAYIKAPPDLVSRAAAALIHCLEVESGQNGHAYITWAMLEERATKFLSDLATQHGNAWPHHDDQLQLVAQHMHVVGSMIAEPSSWDNCTDEEACNQPTFSSNKTNSGGGATSRSNNNQHPLFADDAALRTYIEERLQGITALHIESMIKTLGFELPMVLDSTQSQAVEELSSCPRIGPKTAKKIKETWEASRTSAAATAAIASITMNELIESPPTIPFTWDKDTRCYIPKLHAAEDVIARHIAAKAALAKPPTKARLNKVKAWLELNQQGNDVELCGGQKAAVEAASDAPVLVITGGPGCGKTTAVQTLVKLWSAQGKTVRICAPTGRAAQRLGTIQGIEPSTIHRMLGYKHKGQRNGAGAVDGETDTSNGVDEALTFEHDAFNPLEAHAVLVDEASMLSLPLAAALLKALPPKCQIVFVGDVDQLPPIGAGFVLQSLISSRMVPVIDLREIFRQAAQSSIVTSALAVRRGTTPSIPHVLPSRDQMLEADSDAVLVQVDQPDSIPQAVHQVVKALVSSSPDIDLDLGDLQIISPMRRGQAGTVALNPALQHLLNPPSKDKPEVLRHNIHHATSSTTTPRHIFRLGDRVLQIVNNYDKEVFNGDQGRIVEAYPSERRLVVEYPHLDGDGRKEYQGVELNELELAYAITVHKAQGGESRIVVLALSPKHGRMLTRRLLYTAITRAKERLIVVAGPCGRQGDPLARAASKQDEGGRLSWLTERLAEGAKALGVVEVEPAVYSNEAEVLGNSSDDHSSAAVMDDGSSINTTGSFDEEDDDYLLPPMLLDSSSSSTDIDVLQSADPSSSSTTMYLESNLRVVPDLCRELGLNGDSVERISTLQLLLSEAPLMDAPTIQSSVEKLRSSTSSALQLGLPVILSMVPRLLVSSPDYVERGLAFCQKVGPLDGDDGEYSYNSIEQESLVDQLRRLMAHLNSSSLRE